MSRKSGFNGDLDVMFSDLVLLGSNWRRIGDQLNLL